MARLATLALCTLVPLQLATLALLVWASCLLGCPR